MSIYSVFGPRVPVHSESSQAPSSTSTPYDLLSFLTEQQQDGPAGMDLDNLYPRPPPPAPKNAARSNGPSLAPPRAPPRKTQPSAPRSAVSVAKPATPEPSSPGAAEVESEHGVREASLEIIPLLLASPPSIPAGLKSAELKQRHTILSISPYDVEDYLVTAAPSAKRRLADEAIANLETLKSHVDQLAGIVATETSAMTEIIRSIKFLSPEKGQLMASVDLGECDSDPGLVSIVLKREESPAITGKKAAWKFHNLMPCGAVRGDWIQDPKLALAVHDPPQHTNTAQANLERVRSATSVATSKTTDTFATATERDAGPNADADDSDDDEDSAKQQHFTEAEDFWGGWDDEEQADNAQPPAPPGNQSNQSNAEDDYWNSYDAQDPYDESQKRYAAELQRQHQMDLDTASQVGSVNFDNLERRVREEDLGSMPGDYFGTDAVQSIQARPAEGGRSRGVRTHGAGSVVDQSIPEESPLEGNVQTTGTRSQDAQARTRAPLSFAQIKALSRTENTPSHASTTHPTRSAASRSAASPRSDSTDLGNDDDEAPDDTFEPADHDGSEGTYSHDVTTVAGTVDDQYLSQEASKGQPSNSNQSTFGDSSVHRTSRQGFKSTMTDQDEDDSAAAMRDRQNLNLAADRQTDGGSDPSRRAVDDAEEPEEVLQTPRNSSLPSDQTRERTGSRALPFAYQPPPMSVTGQSTFETPEDMTLADLEAFYRGREQQRMLETRERISRLHRNYSPGDDGSGQEEDDDDEGEARSAIDEARSALGDVVPDYTGLPGFGPSEPAVQKKQSGRSESTVQEKQEQPDQPEEESGPQVQERRISIDKHSSRGPRSDADPIEALAQADPTLAFNAEDEDKDASLQHTIPSNKSVSMDMLRKLAEENRLSGPGVKSGGQKTRFHDSETTSTSGKSKSGGFKNFLQLAPSTVFTDAELEDEPDDEDEPPPPPSEAARPPSVVPEDAEGELEENKVSQETQQPPVGEEDHAHCPGFEHVEAQHNDPPSDNFSVEEQRSEGTMPLEEDDRGDQSNSQGPHQRQEDMPADEPQHGQDADQQEEQDDDSRAAKSKGKNAEDDFDFNAFMFPLQAEEKRRKGAHLDSPGLSDTDPAAKEAMDMITGQSKKGGKKDVGGSSNFDYAASDTFLPGAASDASVRPLAGSVIQRMHLRDSETDIHNIQEEDDGLSTGAAQKDPSSKQSSRPPPAAKRPGRWQGPESPAEVRGMAVDSTNTELGLAEIEDDAMSQDQRSVAPGPQWRGAAPPPGSTSKHTANLRHEYLKWQRQQALQTQRNRIQQQRAQGGLFQDDQSDNGHLVNVDGDDVPAPLARGAAQRAPFPERVNRTASQRPNGRSAQADERGAGRRPGPIRQNTVSDHPGTGRGRPWGAHQIDEGDADRAVGASSTGRLGDDRHQAASEAALPSPVDPAAQTDYTPSPANATWNASRGKDTETPLEGADRDRQPPPTPKGDSRQQFQARQQEARAQASSAAQRRREIIKRVGQRNDHAKNLIKSFIHIINSSESPMAENDFMRLAREAFRESARETEALVANGAGGRAGAGTAGRPAPQQRLPSSGLGKSAAVRGALRREEEQPEEEEAGDLEAGRGMDLQGIPDIMLNGEGGMDDGDM